MFFPNSLLQFPLCSCLQLHLTHYPRGTCGLCKIPGSTKAVTRNYLFKNINITDPLLSNLYFLLGKFWRRWCSCGRCCGIFFTDIASNNRSSYSRTTISDVRKNICVPVDEKVSQNYLLKLTDCFFLPRTYRISHSLHCCYENFL